MAIKVEVLDHHFGGAPQAIGSFLIEAEDALILIESGPASTYENLKSSITKAGYSVDKVKHVLLTHIHLDHAGAAWKFAENGAQIYVHSIGYPHMKDPSRLMASAKLIYKDKMDSLWGTMRAIPERQLVSIEDGQKINIGALTFEAIYTPGHAKHHIAWKVGDVIFTGDVGGAKINNGPIVPPCPPPDIDVELWKDSLNKLESHSEVQRYYLTHYGLVTNLKEHRRELSRTLDHYASFIQSLRKNKISIAEAIPKFVDFVDAQLKEYGLDDKDLQAYQAANPADMSVAGLYRYWKKKEDATP